MRTPKGFLLLVLLAFDFVFGVFSFLFSGVSSLVTIGAETTLSIRFQKSRPQSILIFDGLLNWGAFP